MNEDELEIKKRTRLELGIDKRKTSYADISLMILLTGVLIYTIGVMIEEIFDIMEIAICGIIIIGVASIFFCIFVYKEF